MRRLRDRRLRGVPLWLAVLLAVAGGARGYFTARGAGTAAASIARLSAPGNAASASLGSTVSVTWSGSTFTASLAATSYTVERYDASGNDLGAASCSPVPASSGSPNAFGSFTCTDSPSAGTYKYKVTAHYNSSWTTATAFTNAATAQSATTTTVTAPATDATNTAIARTAISLTLSGATSGASGALTFTVFGPQASAPTSCTSGGTAV